MERSHAAITVSLVHLTFRCVSLLAWCSIGLVVALGADGGGSTGPSYPTLRIFKQHRRPSSNGSHCGRSAHRRADPRRLRTGRQVYANRRPHPIFGIPTFSIASSRWRPGYCYVPLRSIIAHSGIQSEEIPLCLYWRRRCVRHR